MVLSLCESNWPFSTNFNARPSWSEMSWWWRIRGVRDDKFQCDSVVGQTWMGRWTPYVRWYSTVGCIWCCRLWVIAASLELSVRLDSKVQVSFSCLDQCGGHSTLLPWLYGCNYEVVVSVASVVTVYSEEDIFVENAACKWCTRSTLTWCDV